MSDELKKQLQEKLTEEKWTRAALSSYSVSQFEEFDSLIDKIHGEGIANDALTICNEHLTHTQNSVVALYISGILRIEKRPIDDQNLTALIELFADHHKWKIVEYLCNRVLQYGENRFALKTLAHWYETEGLEDKKLEIWERLIKVDYEESELVKILAQKKEENGKIDEAIDLYKKALHRYINKNDFSNIKEIWEKLISLKPDDLSFYEHAETKITQVAGIQKSIQLIYSLFEAHKNNKNKDIPISLLKKILDYDPQDPRARKELIEAYKEKYKGHSYLNEYIKLSSLEQNFRNIHEAIEDFEKHIEFDVGNFVFHRSWGVGRIRSIENNEIVIDFVKKRNHSMSLSLAIESLTALDKSHIWVLKAVSSKEKLKKMIMTKPRWAVETLIKSLGNDTNMREIKAELVPAILSQREWNTWSVKAREQLKTNPMLGNVPGKSDRYMVRMHPVSFEEKLYTQFRAERNFFSRLKTIEEYLEKAEPDTEYFNEMLEYFIGFLRLEEVNENTITSALFLSRLFRKYPYLGEKADFNLSELFERIGDVRELFSKISDTEYKRLFLEYLKINSDKWAEAYKVLLPAYLNKYIIDTLKDAGRTDIIQQIVTELVDRYKEEREAFIWLIRTYIDEKWFMELLSISFERVLINFIHLLDISFREIENSKNVPFNRKINRQVQSFLFQEERIVKYLKSANEEAAIRVYSLLIDVEQLDPSILISIKNIITQKFPDIKLPGEVEAVKSIPRGIMATQASYEAKQKELKHLLEVEVPKNSKEIGAALLLGDLKENAEYKAAKEKQEMLNSTIGKLKEELEKVQIVKPENVDANSIGFGTVVTLLNNDSGKEEVYTIMGPWESDPNKGVISYLSPFGVELYGHKKDENLKFTINEREYDYTVKDIKPAKF
ncbi:transcription elongation factor GreA [Spirochaetia bacterium 38H-sp]|uniref:Transcription elongation factor GreA n=1 Tax=Rarispira pelagica TaxID=3141764 RepID=A0ABU9UAL7_9SPIR